MNRRHTLILTAALCAAPLTASAEQPPPTICEVSDRQYSQEGPQLQSSRLDEISGLAVSRVQPNVMWVHNDSGDAPNIYAVNSLNGELIGAWKVRGASASDWEDMALARCDSKDPSSRDCLFIADIGNNSRGRTDQVIYRVREPNALGAATDATQTTVEASDAFPVVYELPAGEPEPNPDAESLAVHPVTGKLYIVTKEQGKGRVLESDPPGAPGTPLTFRVIGEVDLPTPTAADISRDGSLLIVKSYFEAREYKITNNDVGAAVQAEGRQIILKLEPQGESIAYAEYVPDTPADYYTTEDDSNPYDFYTISEKESQPIWRYSYECDIYRPPITPEPHDMGTDEEPDMGAPPSDLGVEDMADAPDAGSAADMGGASSGGAGDGCSSAGAAPAALLWLLAPLVARVRRRKGGDV